MQDLNANMMRRFDRIDDELAKVNTRIDDMEVQIWKIKESLVAEDEDDVDDEMSS